MSDMSGAQIIVAILGGGGITAVLGAVIQGVFSRKKLGADATEIITKAAAGVVERTEADNARLRSELADERREREAERDEFRRIVDAHTRVLQLHASWDAVVVAKLREAGVEGLPTPPPLYAPDATPGDLLH